MGAWRRGPWFAGLALPLLFLCVVLPSGADLFAGLLRTAGAEEESGELAEAGFAWRDAGSEGLKVRGLSSLRIHPKNAAVLWAYVHGMGPASSEDGGRTWTPRLKGIPEKALPQMRSNVRISFDPQKVKTAYVVIDGQIFRTEDGGESWDTVTSGALASLSWNKLNSSHLSWQVEVDPRKSVRLLVGTLNDGHHNGGLFESKNSGKAWEQVSGTDIPKSGLGNDTFLIRQDSKSDKYLTVAGRKALWRSDDMGRNFERNDPGGAGGIHDYRDMTYLVSGSKDFYVADTRGIWRSKDGGKKWEKKPVLPGDALVVVQDPYNKKRVYAVLHDTGIWVSEDPRKTKWAQLGGAYGDGGSSKDEANKDEANKDEANEEDANGGRRRTPASATGTPSFASLSCIPGIARRST